MAEISPNRVSEEVEDKDLVLVLTPGDMVEEVNTQLLKSFNQEKGLKTVYVTVSKPYKTKRNILEDDGVDTGQIFFIDCITKLNADPPSRVENCVFLNPQALTDISIALTQAVESLPDDEGKLLIFDTLSTLMLYNDDEVVGKFAHSIASKIREWGVKSIMLTLEEETDEQVISQLSQFCDSTIYVEPE